MRAHEQLAGARQMCLGVVFNYQDRGDLFASRWTREYELLAFVLAQFARNELMDIFHFAHEDYVRKILEPAA